MIDTDGWGWVFTHGRDETLAEEAEILRWIEAGAPDPDEWRASQGQPTPSKLPSAPTGVEIPSVALAVDRTQAASLLSMSVDHFERHVLPDLRVIQTGRKQTIPVRELENWMSARAARALKS